MADFNSTGFPAINGFDSFGVSSKKLMLFAQPFAATFNWSLTLRSIFKSSQSNPQAGQVTASNNEALISFIRKTLI